MVPVSGKYLVVGLGNPGKDYVQTRHNAGFMVVEALGQKWGITGAVKPKFQAIVGMGEVSGLSKPVSVILAQPTTYMNLSGEAVSKLLHFYQIPLERMLVITDDVALPLGKIRIRSQGRDGGHNGLKSVMQHCGQSTNFSRLRLGVGQPVHGGHELKDYVLGRFSSDEQRVWDAVLTASVLAVEQWLVSDVTAVMTTFNGCDFSEGL